MRRDRLYLSTISDRAGELARQYGCGVELAEFCTAWNLDRELETADRRARKALEGLGAPTFHAPYNELFPCAIDPLARQLAAYRYRQSLEAADRYGAEKVVVHAGYTPNVYYDCWFEEQSALFWQEFLPSIPEGKIICLENVLEPRPENLLHIVEAVNSPRLRVCLDLGHLNVRSQVPMEDWLTMLSPWISHFHIHNNDGTFDAHDHLFRGTIPMKSILKQAMDLCPTASFTMEICEPEEDLHWLEQEGLLSCPADRKHSAQAVCIR